MKNNFFITLIIAIQSCSFIKAQRGLIFRPLIDAKISYSDYGVFGNPIDNPYYKFSKNTDKFPSILFGILVEKAIGRYSVASGIIQDVASSSVIIRYTTSTVYNGQTFINNNATSSSGGIDVWKFPLLISREIIPRQEANSISLSVPKLKHALFVFGGIHFIFNPDAKNAGNITTTGGMDYVVLSTGDSLKITNTTSPSSKFGYSLELGLRNKFSYKHTELFTLSLSYAYGLKNLAYQYTTINIKTASTNLIYTESVLTKGSGLYLQLSRVFSFSKKKKEETKNL